MSLAQMLGQLLVVGFDGTTVTPEVAGLIQHEHIGGIILFSRNLRDAEQTLALTRELQALARAAGHPHPLLIATDQENGVVRRLGRGTTIFPGNMALAATGTDALAYDIALATGRELTALGINLNLAPVLDINNNPANPVIGVRSFGEDPDQVARFGVAAVRGYQQSGVLNCVKHFPGHGDTAVDSHRALPAMPHALQRLDAVELVPFRAALAAGADSVMIAHVALARLTGTDALPATLAPGVVRELLRERLGFDGVVISDCLEMRAVSETVGTERGAVMALQAGIDLLLVSHRYDRQLGSLRALQAALERGEIPPEAVRRAAEHVAELKVRAISWEDQPDGKASVPEWVGGEAHRRLAMHAYEHAVTLVRDDQGIVPLRLAPDMRLLVVYPRGAAPAEADEGHVGAGGLVESIRRRHPAVDELAVSLQPTDAERAEAQRQAAGADVILVVTVDAYRNEPQAELARDLARTGRRTIGLAVRDPYDLVAYPAVGTYLATYEYTAPALETAARVLFGELRPQGRLPVTLPGLYARGHRQEVDPERAH
jgi:beta-N-acetylhexosaminidase